MKNVFKINCPKCNQKFRIYVVDKKDEVKGIKIDSIVHEEGSPNRKECEWK